MKKFRVITYTDNSYIVSADYIDTRGDFLLLCKNTLDNGYAGVEIVAAVRQPMLVYEIKSVSPDEQGVQHG